MWIEVKHHVYVKQRTQICTTWPSFPFTCRLLFIIITHKLVVSHNFLTKRIVLSCLYLIIFCFAKFSTWIWRFPYTWRLNSLIIVFWTSGTLRSVNGDANKTVPKIPFVSFPLGQRRFNYSKQCRNNVVTPLPSKFRTFPVRKLMYNHDGDESEKVTEKVDSHCLKRHHSIIPLCSVLPRM